MVVILHGSGGSLGSFEVFARSLRTSLTPKSSASDVTIQFVNRRADFFNYLYDPPFRHKATIDQLHIFSHSIGAGLFLAYGDPETTRIRDGLIFQARQTRRRLTYQDVVAAEVGTILTDDLVRAPFTTMCERIRSNFAPDAFIKLWGCNSGVEDWIYSDNGAVDESEDRVAYYWRALNEQNVPKPSVAAAMAQYFARTTYGASSGAHIEVLHRGQWVSSARYKAAVGDWPSGVLQHRLSPDRGVYRAYSP